MATLQIDEKSAFSTHEIEVRYDLARRKIQDVPCSDRWIGGCINKNCPAFRNVKGYYFCIRH